MEFIRITADNGDGVAELSRVASEIVREHYDPLLGPEQNTYMINMFQSVPAITEQLHHGYRYYLLRVDGADAGFMGFYPREGAMYLSKFYLYKEFRRQGHSREMLDFLKSESEKEGLRAIELNVNKYNDALLAYKALGFGIIRAEVNDIGHGYVMDDYVCRLEW
jgi:GNAT superfamily N-acetyltransferase